ncbi:hypothetical protein TWF506_004762 [Arthrobotrys conoides]|uniref:Uncharacterized protein n=1 Tax=Arthrobotrys conoides TaxID=74498 RepID=A0AAN8N2L9_9PEZI
MGSHQSSPPPGFTSEEKQNRYLVITEKLARKRLPAPIAHRVAEPEDDTEPDGSSDNNFISGDTKDLISNDQKAETNLNSAEPRELEVSVLNGSILEKLVGTRDKEAGVPRLEHDYINVHRVKKEAAISPLAPAGSRRAYRPRSSTALQAQPTTDNKLAHRSNSERYQKLTARVRNVIDKTKRFTMSRREDIRSRERLFRQLRQNMPLPEAVSKCFERLAKNVWQISNPIMRERLQQYSFKDMCDIFKLSNLEPEEYIFHLGWKGTHLDEPEILRYIVLIGKHAAGLTPWPGHGG